MRTSTSSSGTRQGSAQRPSPPEFTLRLHVRLSLARMLETPMLHGTNGLPSQASPRPRTLDITLLALLLLGSALFLLELSRAKFFWNDEALTYYTVHHRSLLDVFRFQASTPVVLEPPTHDLLVWCANRLFGDSKLALRLPSLLSFLLLQGLLYRLATLVGGRRAGLLAALLMVGTQAAGYGAEARPYALLTALTLAAPLLWYRLRTAGPSAQQRGYAVALAAVLALAVTTQFLGAVIVYPVLLAEIVLCFAQRHRPNLRVLCAVGAGLLAVVLDMPFVRAVRPYRPAVPFNVAMHLSTLPPVYLWGFLHEPQRLADHLAPTAYLWVLLLGSLVLSFPSARQQPPGSGDVASRRALWAALAGLALYPVPILLIAHFATHYFQPRYAVQCIPGLVALFAICLTRFTYRLGRVPVTLLALAAVAFTLDEAHFLLKDTRLRSAQVTDRYLTSAAVRATLLAHPKAPVYVPIDQCILYPFYGDPTFAPRLRCLYSAPTEQRFANTELTSLTTRILTQRTDMPYPAASYEAMRADRQALFAYFDYPWLSWLPTALAADHAQSTPAGTGFGGTVYQVTFPGSPTAAP